MARRIALLLLVLATAAPGWWRAVPDHSAPIPPCRPAPAGEPPRHWLGCAADDRPSRAPADEERLLLGWPLDPNRAGARALAFVPGLSARLGQAVVDDRIAHGRFGSVEELRRVSGIGEKRLARSRASLEVGPP
jgi:competence protein ComEA